MLQLLATLPLSNENGLARTPPLGWRSWNTFGADVNQSLIEGIMDGMVRKDRKVDGVPTSLCDLGYCDVGLDDNWQQCSTTKGGLRFHDQSGTPLVNTERFPDMAAMTAHAHKLGLTAGWRGSNCNPTPYPSRNPNPKLHQNIHRLKPQVREQLHLQREADGRAQVLRGRRQGDALPLT